MAQYVSLSVQFYHLGQMNTVDVQKPEVLNPEAWESGFWTIFSDLQPDPQNWTLA